MSEALDPLEAELSALRPHEVSPGLRRRIAERLADSPPARFRWPWRLVLAGSLAAACLAAVLLRWAGGRRDESRPIVIASQPAPSAEVEDSEPTLLAYHRALGRSQDELDALFDKHARVSAEPSPEFARICVFTRADAALHALLGED